VYLQEPGRFRQPRDAWEAVGITAAERVEQLFPAAYPVRVLLTHMRPEVARGHAWPLLGDARQNRVLGYRNRGGTLDEAGMLFANQASWAHVLEAVAALLDKPLGELLSVDELAAVQGRGDPRCLR
tara:strand:- start:513 stop:890 length:378 start_codon:yes stop_codon:yes gene_type:complete